MAWRIDRLAALATWLLWVGPLLRAAEQERPPAPLRALIVSDGAPQDRNVSTLVLKAILCSSGRFDISVCEAPNGLSSSTLSPFDVVVVANALPRGSEAEKAIAAFVAAGKGLVVTHGAFSAADLPRDLPLTANAEARLPVRFLDVKIAAADHPIVQGMDVTFRTADSVPSGLAARPDTQVIASTDDGGGSVPVLAIAAQGKGRIAALALGCDPSATYEPHFRALFARATEWAASGAVTLPAALGAPGPSPDGIRALLVTGGHDHEAAFYSLFSGRPALESLPVDTAANAFKKDLRGQYDVIIMYDFTRDLDGVGKKNLRDFVESGKGIVVLHHALLNYQTWTWWSEDVVGGRYRLQREGESPSSSVKNDQRICASPVGTHPVIEGIHPFLIIDETYKNQYLSPRIKPLLTTDNAASDNNLAWIGPCETSRVVAIQLGHGRTAFGHPSYRLLVHNAVQWAAGKTK
jgi:type 1 glutamine amidotransferase